MSAVNIVIRMGATRNDLTIGTEVFPLSEKLGFAFREALRKDGYFLSSEQRTKHEEFLRLARAM